MKLSKLFLILVVVMIALYGFQACQEKEDDPWTNSDGTPVVCRRVSCGKKPVYPDWNRRYCEVHIQDTHSCRYPKCYTDIPNESGEVYCPEHRDQ